MNKSQRITLVTALIGSSFLLFNQLPYGQSSLEKEIEELQKMVEENEQKEKEAEEAEGERQENQSLEYKYGNTTKTESLWDQCVEYGSRTFMVESAVIYFMDKCKPIIKEFEINGYYVSDIGKKYADVNADMITLVKSYEETAQDCLYENFQVHFLLHDNDKCQRVIEYYLANGYDLVDKYDNKVELIQNNSSLPVNK